MSPSDRRRPTAFPLDEVRVVASEEAARAGGGKPPLVLTEPDADDDRPPAVTIPKRPRRWSRILLAALGGLLTLAIGLAIDNLIRDLFARTDWLGWLAVALTALAVLALIVLATREILGLLRLRLIDHIRARAVEAAEADDRNRAREAARELIGLYVTRPETARGRSALGGHIAEIIDGRDLIGLAETELLLPFDETARTMVLNSAKRVALVTAVSPRAVVDLLFVGAEILRLIRRLAGLYGGRPGVFGFLRLTRAAIAHLAVTGGIAAGDSLIQQFLGHGIAARLSARLGEGVINGLLTARIGIAAIEVCRPLPFISGRPPRLSDIMAELTRLSGSKPAEPD